MVLSILVQVSSLHHISHSETFRCSDIGTFISCTSEGVDNTHLHCRAASK